MEAGDATARRDLMIDVTSAGAQVRVSVADTGHGIPPDRIDRLFEPDFTLKAGGTGLGLAVVRQAVAAHGGRVSAVSRQTGGAVFIVELPLSPPAPHHVV
jgi:signal transduction histidine kinase